MRKRAALAALIIITAVLMGGCWNYRGLDEMAIASGLAIDRDAASGLYHLSFEYVDLTGPVKEQGIKAGLVEGYGPTLFDAVRNVKKRIVNKIWLGHMELVVLSSDVVRSTDISSLIDFFLRDAECRETMCMAVSQEPTAMDLLSIEGIGQPMVAFEIHKIIEEDNKVTLSTDFKQIYEVYNILNSEGIELTLPAFHNTLNDGESVSEANGIAVFKGERLAGYLEPEESKYFLFVTDKVEGGVITCSSRAEGPEDTTLEISENHTKTSFQYRDGQLTMKVETQTKAYLNELDEPADALDPSQIQLLETSGARKVMQGIANVIERVRGDFGSDIFGFGNTIYKQDYKLWQQLKDNWDEVFAAMTIDINCKVHIVNSASIKKS
jgi:spore germination protein KC